MNLIPFRQTAILHRTIRQYFDKAGFLEVATPILSPDLIPEEHIELFQTHRLDTEGKFHPLYLVPSPEYWMKLLLADGAPSLYQIARCFRNGEQWDNWHRWEFTMLEWYELDRSAIENIPRMMDILALTHKIVADETLDTSDYRKMTMEQAFSEYAGFSLTEVLDNAGYADSRNTIIPHLAKPEEFCNALRHKLLKYNLPPGSKSDSPADLFHRLFLTLVECRLPDDKPLFLTDWPALIPTLARRKMGTPWSDRWEMYFRGVEVANCYGEETDRSALLAYWKEQNKQKSFATVPMHVSTDWPEKIAADMPTLSGAAVGLDRLLALVRGDDDLHQLDIFS